MGLQYSYLHEHKSSHFVDFHEKCIFGTFKAKFFKKPSLDFAKINFFLIYRPYSLNPKRSYPGSFFFENLPPSRTVWTLCVLNVLQNDVIALPRWLPWSQYAAAAESISINVFRHYAMIKLVNWYILYIYIYIYKYYRNR